MEIKEFKDYPDTSTPINSENLNDNFNEIKSVVNANDDRLTTVETGWIPANETWTYVSFDSETLTGVVSSNLDMTPYLNVGMKVKFTQNSAIKYAFITAITSTQLTLFLGTDYSINSSAISNTYYSMLKTPYGFPMNPEKWELTFIRNSNDLYATVTTTNYYGGANNKLTVPVGTWEIEYNYTIQITSAAATCYSRLALSQSSSEITERSLLSNFVMPLTAGTFASQRFVNSKIYNLTEEKTFYLLFKNDMAYIDLYFVGSSAETSWIKAKCAYL